MKLQVKYEELNKISSNIKEDNKNINESLENIKKTIDQVSSAWSGEDSETFVAKANETITSEKDRNKKIEVLGNMLEYAAKSYKEEDDGWVEIIKKEEINS